MKESYLIQDFRRTAAQRFPARSEQLNAAFDARLRALKSENAGAGPSAPRRASPRRSCKRTPPSGAST